MAVQDRVHSLRAKHADLEKAIVKETTRTLPDAEQVTRWKREKLRIKDAIVELTRD
ncbi:MAG TPA: YdcH family protein [Stellaceae bacterium]|nr:YdcH family protein [Stellaceae bacterium]